MARQVSDSDAWHQPRPLRSWLGMAQMFVAVTAFVFLVQTGVSGAALTVAGLATVLSLASRWLFRRRR